MRLSSVDDVVECVVRAGGVRRTVGMSQAHLRAAFRSGALERVRHGVVAVPGADPIRVLAARAGGVPSCGSAAALLGLELLRPQARPHVTVPRGQRPSGCAELVVHRRDIPILEGLPTPERVAADAARCMPEPEAIVVVDAVLRRGGELQAILAELRGPGATEARRVVRRGDARSMAVGETLQRLAFADAGIPAVPQACIHGVGFVDFLIAGWLVVEVDGFAFHWTSAQFAADRQRTTELLRQGYEVLRFSHRDVVERPAYVLETVRLILSRGRPRVGSSQRLR